MALGVVSEKPTVSVIVIVLLTFLFDGIILCLLDFRNNGFYFCGFVVGIHDGIVLLLCESVAVLFATDIRCFERAVVV